MTRHTSDSNYSNTISDKFILQLRIYLNVYIIIIRGRIWNLESPIHLINYNVIHTWIFWGVLGQSVFDKCILYWIILLYTVDMNIEGCFLVSSLEFCPAHRRGQWRFALWAHCASEFVCACLCCCLLVFTHSPGINKAHGQCFI